MDFPWHHALQMMWAEQGYNFPTAWRIFALLRTWISYFVCFIVVASNSVESEDVLVIYHHVTNHPQTEWLKTGLLIISHGSVNQLDTPGWFYLRVFYVVTIKWCLGLSSFPYQASGLGDDWTCRGLGKAAHAAFPLTILGFFRPRQSQECQTSYFWLLLEQAFQEGLGRRCKASSDPAS